MIKRLVLAAMVAVLLAGCGGDAEDLGVVARVNGRPIPLSQLEFQHDLLHMDSSGTFVPTVEALRQEYGQLLADLIVQELVLQELEKRNLGVTDKEMEVEEQKVRADYPDDAFEQVLIEEYIDLGAWRQQLRYHRARQKFQQQVLRPQVKIDYREAEAYYRDHINDYRLPESLRMVVLRAASKERIQQAAVAYGELGNIPQTQRRVPGVALKEIMARPGQLSQPWQEVLKELPAGELSTIMEQRSGFEALLVLERVEAKQLTPTQAYSLVEETLLQQKLRSAFAAWLEQALAEADIRISAHLLAGDEAVEPTEEEVREAAAEVALDPEDGSGEPLGPDTEEQ